ncbi:MAG: macro domain-containing protein [Lagierella massiliensis]|nr:macro domain-containing protein [Lagierella massiliensis]
MDIRITFDETFDLECSGLVFFSENSLLDESTNKLIDKAGDRIIEPLSKIGSIPTGEVKVIPGFDLNQLYIFLTVLPENLDSDLNKKLFKDSLDKLIKLANEYDIDSIAINLVYLKERYGEQYIENLNRVLRSKEYKFNDLVVFLYR